MGRRVDRWALGGLLAAGFYLLFLNAWGSVPVAGGLAFACCLLARRALRLWPPRRRVTGDQVAEWLNRIAALEDAGAQAELEALVRERYPDEAFRLVPVLKHPEATLSCGDVLNAWKANRPAERLVIASTCPCEPRAALFARELSEPRVAVVDSRALGRLLKRRREAPAPPLPPPRPLAKRLARLAASLAHARFSLKTALLALAMLVIYLRWGNGLYLFAGLGLLFHQGACLLGRRAGRRLFESEGS